MTCHEARLRMMTTHVSQTCEAVDVFGHIDGCPYCEEWVRNGRIPRNDPDLKAAEEAIRAAIGRKLT